MEQKALQFVTADAAKHFVLQFGFDTFGGSA